MVETHAVIRQRADLHLDSLISLVDDLPGLDNEWEEMTESAQASMSLEWDHLMADVLTELAEYARDGLLSPDQQERYQDLKRKLKALLPLIQKLNWYRPPIPLEA
ncbi:MAG: hypothetical protein HY689_07010 [Chloroflexi bacterium]|nr:hypothetical protein [Chloroflexota bacterium]